VTFLLSTKHVDEVQQEFTSDMALSVSARHDTARFNMTHHDKFCHVEQNRIWAKQASKSNVYDHCRARSELNWELGTK